MSAASGLIAEYDYSYSTLGGWRASYGGGALLSMRHSLSGENSFPVRRLNFSTKEVEDVLAPPAGTLKSRGVWWDGAIHRALYWEDGLGSAPVEYRSSSGADWTGPFPSTTGPWLPTESFDLAVIPGALDPWSGEPAEMQLIPFIDGVLGFPFVGSGGEIPPPEAYDELLYLRYAATGTPDTWVGHNLAKDDGFSSHEYADGKARQASVAKVLYVVEIDRFYIAGSGGAFFSVSGPSVVSCFWTNFNLTYEICGEAGVGGATFWPVNAPDFTVGSWEDGGETFYSVTGVGDPLFLSDNFLELQGDWLEGQHPRDTINWSVLPVAEVWTYNSNAFGDNPKGQFVVQTGGPAASASISAAHVSGVERTFSIDETFQQFALLGLSYNDPVDYTDRDSVYDLTVDGETFRIHIRSSYVAF